MMVQKIPKWVLSSIVVCGFWGCSGTPTQQETLQKNNNTSSTQTIATLQKANSRLKQELDDLKQEKDPAKWIAKLESENNILKTELGNLNKQLDAVTIETGSHSSGETETDPLSVKKQTLKNRVNDLIKQVEERTKKMDELQKLISTD